MLALKQCLIQSSFSICKVLLLLSLNRGQPHLYQQVEYDIPLFHVMLIIESELGTAHLILLDVEVL